MAKLATFRYIVAEVTQPSLGVGYEIAKAEEMGKLILCLYRPSNERSLSAMISGNKYKNLIIKYYKTEGDVEKILRDFFQKKSLS